MATPPLRASQAERPQRTPLIDQRLVAGFLLGPLAGALLYAAVVRWTRPNPEDFFYYAATSLGYGYAISLIVLLPAFLLLRHLRLDRWLVCGAVGLITGFVFYRLVFHLPANEDNIPSLVLYGAIPFLCIALAIRLIAGKRL